MSDLMSMYLSGCSPYIATLIYDISNRVLILECVDDPEKRNPLKRIVFSGIRSYSEQTIEDEYDDNCIDGVIGMHWMKDKLFCLSTDKKEIIIELEVEPQVESLA